MKLGLLLLATALMAIPVAADTCLAPKNPVKASVVCGRVTSPDGEFVPNVELQLVRQDEVVARVQTDAVGDFMFGPVAEGDYNLTTKGNVWHLFYPIRVTGTKVRKSCTDPLEVRVSFKVCGQWVSKRGYHARF